MSKNEIDIGIYLYGWYNKQKWESHDFKYTPVVGYYDSTSDTLIEWQINQLARTKVDYVILEMVVTEDVSYQTISQHTNSVIPLLQNKGIGYTFIIDIGVMYEKGYTNEQIVGSYCFLITELSKEGYLNDIHHNSSLGKAIFLFSPKPDIIESLELNTPPDLKLYHCLWSPSWENVNDEITNKETLEIFRPYYEPISPETQTLKCSLEKLNYFPFWQQVDELINMQGIVSVIPEYDDLLLSRSPQLAPVVERKRGATLLEQLEKAVKLKASNIIIYGWNEYFESTCIEPTLEYGDFYVHLLTSAINSIKNGENIPSLSEFLPPEKINVIYLSEKLREAANKHSDKVPRWDGDYYRAEISYSESISIDNKISFKTCLVKNIGLKQWIVNDENHPVYLGVKVVDQNYEVVEEHRISLKVDLVLQHEIVTLDFSLNISDAFLGKNYKIILDLVIEHRFWFGNETVVPLDTLDKYDDQ